MRRKQKLYCQDDFPFAVHTNSIKCPRVTNEVKRDSCASILTVVTFTSYSVLTCKYHLGVSPEICNNMRPRRRWASSQNGIWHNDYERSQKRLIETESGVARLIPPFISSRPSHLPGVFTFFCNDAFTLQCVRFTSHFTSYREAYDSGAYCSLSNIQFLLTIHLLVEALSSRDMIQPSLERCTGRSLFPHVYQRRRLMSAVFLLVYTLRLEM